MFTTASHAAKATLQQATAMGLAAFVTLSILAGVNGLATTPARDSLLAAKPAPAAVMQVAANN